MTKRCNILNRDKSVKFMDTFDVIVIGGGPAGLTTAFWSAELGLKAVVLEAADKVGGQIHLINNPIVNYPGCTAPNGKDFLGKFVKSLKSREFKQIINSSVKILLTEENKVLTESGFEYGYRSLVVASGVRKRRLGIEGETAFAGRGILESGTAEAAKTKGKTVAIIGGGDAALENAIILSSYAKKVYLIHRRGQFRAREEFQNRVFREPNIEIVAPAYPVAIEGKDFIEGIVVIDQSGRERLIKVDFLLIRIGVIPNTEFARSSINLDAAGYVLVDRNCRTSVKNVFAVGDCAFPEAPTIPTAVGSGAIAAKNIYNLLKLENSL
jgi:thioredoxin reductase (NADPH)